MTNVACESSVQDDRHPQAVHRQCGGYAAVYGVADDPVRRAVLDRADLEPAFHRPVLRDVDQPLGVDGFGGEVSVDLVVMQGRPSLLPQTAALEDARGDFLQGTRSLHAMFTDLEPHRADRLIRHEPVSELGVVCMDVHGGANQVRVVPSRWLTGCMLQA